MLTSLASDSPVNQWFRLRVLSSSLRKDLKLLSEMFDLDEIDCEIICLVKDKFRVQAKEIALHIYLSRDAARRRAIKLAEKEIMEMVQAKARSPGVIYFRLSSKISSFLAEIKKLGLVDFSRESFLKSQSVKSFAYVRNLQKNQSLEGLIRSLPATRRDVFFLVVTSTQATSPFIADELRISPQAIRYHLECLRKEKWIDRSEFNNNPNAYYYFINPEIDHQIVKSIIDGDIHRLKPQKKMNDDRNKLFEQEISKLNTVDKDLLIEICSNPGLLSNQLGNNLTCSMQTKNKHLNKLINIKLGTREKDSDFPGVRYCYYPASGLTVEVIERFLDSSISTNINHSNLENDRNMNNSTSHASSNSFSDKEQDTKTDDLLSKIISLKEEIEKLEKKVQEKKNKAKELEKLIAEIGGEKATKVISFI